MEIFFLNISVIHSEVLFFNDHFFFSKLICFTIASKVSGEWKTTQVNGKRNIW